jgi:manganese transport protein
MSVLATRLNLSDRTARDIAAVLAGQGRGRLRTAALFAGPAVIASIAYMRTERRL